MARQDSEIVLPALAAGSGPLPSLASCLRAAWARFLFPGASPPPGRAGWACLAILLLLPAAILYPRLSFRLFEPDEGRYAEIPREMLLRGEWIVPYLEGQPYLDKPPLLYWLVMGSYRLFGVHDWAARLVPAIAIHGCVLLAFAWGRRTLGTRAAFWGALALALAPGFATMGRLLVMDGLLALWLTLAWFAGFEAVRDARAKGGWWALSAVACGLGILTKGPVSLLLLLPPLLAFRWLNLGRLAIGWRAWLAFAGVILAVVLPWYVAICVRAPSFALYFLWQHNVVRFLAPFDHLRPFWFYVPILLVGLLPASLVVPGFVRFLLSCRGDRASLRCPELGMLLLAGGWCILFFSMSGCKLPTYVLPAFPPLALALGYYLTVAGWSGGRAIRWGTSTGVILMAIAHYVLVPAYALYHSPLGAPEDILLACRDSGEAVVSYPRDCDSVAFYLGRDDLHTYRTKATPELIEFLLSQPRTVLLFTHRHSLETLRPSLPPELRLTGARALGTGTGWHERLFTLLRRVGGETRPELYHVAVVEHCRPGRP